MVVQNFILKSLTHLNDEFSEKILMALKTQFSLSFTLYYYKTKKYF
jgi:hypothetical protein